MADSIKNSKADKIAAARKKLKEFKSIKNKKEKIQQNETIDSETENIITNTIQQFQEQSDPINDSLTDENPNNTQMIESTGGSPMDDNNNNNNNTKTYDSKIMEEQPEAINQIDMINANPIELNFNDNNTTTTTNLPFFNKFSQNPNQSSDNIINNQFQQQQQNQLEHLNNNNNGIPKNIIEDFAKHSVNIESLNQLSNEIYKVLQTDDFNGNLPSSSSSHHSIKSNQNGLEQRNQDLAGLLSQEKIHNQELNMKLVESGRTIDRLQLEMEKLKFDTTKIRQMEIEPIKEQLKVQQQTVGILVGEKSELLSALTKYQSLANNKVAEVEELQGRLNASRYRVQELEKQNTNSKTIQQKLDGSQLKLCSELEMVQDELKQVRRTLDEQSDEITELKQRIHLKSEELIAIQYDLCEKDRQLNMAQLKIEQLTSGDDLIQSDGGGGGRIERLNQENLMYQQQLKELHGMMEQLGQERDQSSQQYQTYVQHLNKETANLAEKLNVISDDNKRLSEREENLIKHIGDLERQIQQQMITQQKLINESTTKQNTTIQINGESNKTIDDADNVDDVKIKENTIELERFNELQQTLEQRTQQCLSLQLQLQEKLQQVTELEMKIEREQREPIDTKNLFATIESDKLAASRAVSQNQELKQQLDEIQKAYIQLSNDKLELTNKLQSEQHLGREIKLRFTEIDTELRNVKDRLHFKDEEMIRLTHENTVLTKQILKLSQELDQLRHYDMKSQSDLILKQKLQYANDEIVKLRKHLDMQIDGDKLNTEKLSISNVKEQQQHQQNLQNIHNHDEHEHEHEHEHNHNDVDDHKHDHGHGHSHSPSNPPHPLDQSDAVSITSTINIATNEAMEKLQQRFTRTMAEIADLTEEKHRLEHLVMQLHGETETIGEYIALYQTQRRLLKQREIEKDQQLQRIAGDREEMQEKLLQLNHLVEDLLLGKTSEKIINNLVKKQENTNSNNLTNDKQQQREKLLNNEIQIIEHDQSSIEQRESSNLLSKNISEQTSKGTAATATTTETATKILTLLSDIKEKNLKFTDSISSEINHHCPCCSGQLQTV